MKKAQSTTNSKDIKASPEIIYRAFTDPKALEKWLAPGDMTGKVHHFDLRPGGGYEMSLYYSSTDKESRGKTSANEDRFNARFTEIVPNEKIVQVVIFDSADPDFAGEMIMEATFEPVGGGTRVTFHFENIPAGIKPEDNEEGTISTLEKLAKYAEKSSE